MKLLFDSFWRAVAYCFHPKVIGLSLLPLLVAGVLTLGLNALFWTSALDAVRSVLEYWSLVNSMLQWMSQVLGNGFRTVFEQMILIALEIPVVVAFVLVLAGLWSTPGAVAMVSARRFPTLERRHGGAWWKGLLWSLLWTFIALLAVLVTLPLWLVPGLALLLPPLIWGWLTAHVMGFDALAEHATAEERQGILRAHRWPMLVMGILTGFLCGVPSLIWTLGPGMLIAAPFVLIVAIWLYTMIFTFSALWFTHYALTALAALRAAETAMHAVQPSMPGAAPLPLVEEVPVHERFAGPGDDDNSANAL
jgi:hypothetical protein